MSPRLVALEGLLARVRPHVARELRRPRKRRVAVLALVPLVGVGAHPFGCARLALGRDERGWTGWRLRDRHERLRRGVPPLVGRTLNVARAGATDPVGGKVTMAARSDEDA